MLQVSAVRLHWSHKIQEECHTFLNTINGTLEACSLADKEIIKIELFFHIRRKQAFKINGSQESDD